LTNLFNVFLICPQSFIDLSSKEQALALRIDTSTHDAKIKSLKEEMTLLSRDVKNLGVSDPVEKTEKVDILKLTQDRQLIVDENVKQGTKQSVINYYNKLTKAFIDQLDKEHGTYNPLVAENTNIHQQIVDFINKKIETLPKPEAAKPTDEIDKKIANANQTNDKAAKYVQYQEWLVKVEAANKKVKDNKDKQEKAAEERLNYIKSKKLPFNNLSLDEDGALMLDGRPIKPQYFSSGQLLKVVPLLMATQSPELKYVFIQNFNLLDEANQQMIEKYLSEKGFQLVIEMVSDKVIPGKNCILLKDCKVVSGDPQPDAGPNLTI